MRGRAADRRLEGRVLSDLWGDEAEMRSFRDRWRGSIQNYLDWIKPVFTNFTAF